MFKQLFSNKNRDKWIVTVKNGDMIRRCPVTGRTEYRDTVNQCWVGFENLEELAKIRHQAFALPK